MGFSESKNGPGVELTATICRISAEGSQWRVRVETLDEGDEVRGRFVFEPDGPAPLHGPREGPPALRGRSRQQILADAYEVSERQLREVLRSLA